MREVEEEEEEERVYLRRRWRRASAAVDSRESVNVSIFPDNFFGEAGVVGFSDKKCSFEKLELGCFICLKL